ncbi:PhoH family protein [Candidatus Saccharibacteria bacterium]|nr:PhoH family protein [Candidatus Saccharibacteria bacterium]
MSGKQPIYVIDTNVLVDYGDIIPNGEKIHLEEPLIDLSGAHMVIPTAVVRELSSFKGEKSERGKAARVVLKRLRRIIEGKVRSMDEIYHLKAPIRVSDEGQMISILPVHKKFKEALPFSPSEDDMDGQIILAALTVAFIDAGLRIDGTAKPSIVEELVPKNVILLTNDNGLAIRARERGILTNRYGYKYPKPYIGRRDIVVPKELFQEFICNKRVERSMFESLMPQEQRLVANEFIIMSLGNEEEYPYGFDPTNNPYFENIGRYDVKEDAIVALKYLRNFPLEVQNAGQAIYAEALEDPNISAVICTGPAGSGKTFMATVYGYNACKNGNFIGVTAVPCESQSKIGALPGDLDEKMDPDVQPLKNSLRNYLMIGDKKIRKELNDLAKMGTGSKREAGAKEPTEKTSIKAKLKDRVDLIWENWFSSIPIENARGRDFTYELAIYDEFQDQNIAQADTLIKRIGSNGKIIITGDIEQIHAPYLDHLNNGLVYAGRQLFDSEMVAQVCFTDDEVIRHPLVKLVARRQKMHLEKNSRN